jgi:methionyl-tRNA formyltransferase
VRLAYFGTSEFAVPALQALAPHVALVVTQPSRPTGRGNNLVPTPVGAAAAQFGLPIQSPDRARDPGFIQEVEEQQFDALVVASYGQILSERLLNAARRGGINLHASILPKHRGAAPIARAILEGDPTTGVTLMQMDKGMDTGDMIAVTDLAIGGDETTGHLESRLAQAAAELAVQWMPKIIEGDYTRIPQNHEAATLAAKIERREARFDFAETAELAYRRFRAFTPKPGAFLATAHGDLKVLSCKPGTRSGPPGRILELAEGLEIAFARGSLLLELVQPAGKKPVSGNDFANGRRLVVGDGLD